MAIKTLEIKTSRNIHKTINEVFEAIVDNKKMSEYFIRSSSGRMEEGKTLIWQFPEIDVNFPIRVDKIEKDKYISYYWDDVDGTPTLTEMMFTQQTEDNTKVVITEKSRDNNKAGLKWLKGHTEGWSNFLDCLKAYLEYGINLRVGAFDKKQLEKDFSKANTKKKSNK